MWYTSEVGIVNEAGYRIMVPFYFYDSKNVLLVLVL